MFSFLPRTQEKVTARPGLYNLRRMGLIPKTQVQLMAACFQGHFANLKPVPCTLLIVVSVLLPWVTLSHLRLIYLLLYHPPGVDNICFLASLDTHVVFDVTMYSENPARRLAWPSSPVALG